MGSNSSSSSSSSSSGFVLVNIAKGEEERKEGEDGREAREGMTLESCRGENEEGVVEEGEEEKKGMEWREVEGGEVGQMFMMFVWWVVVGERAMGKSLTVEEGEEKEGIEEARVGVVGEVVGGMEGGAAEGTGGVGEGR
jgi:hypothetical protein